MKSVVCTVEKKKGHQFWNLAYVNKMFGFFKFFYLHSSKSQWIQMTADRKSKSW